MRATPASCRDSPGHFDASVGIPRLGVLTGDIDRSMGDVHPYGSPHYLLDPVNGLRVAKRLQERFAQLRPERAEYFAARYADFETRLLGALVGEELRAALSSEALAEAAFEGRLEALLARRSEHGSALGGWLGAMAPHAGALAVADHDLWTYFAARFGLRVVAFLEPKPGVTPSTRHLGEVVERMRRDGIQVILSVPYFSTRYAEKVSEATGASGGRHGAPGGRPEGSRRSYLSMVDWNVRKLADAL